MTDKEYMLQILRIDDRIDSINRDIEAQIERRADTLSATDYSKDRISGGSCSDLSNIMVGIEQCGRAATKGNRTAKSHQSRSTKRD